MQSSGTSYDILVVDDTPSNLKVISAILEKQEDFIISVAITGEQALERAERCIPDLILLDVMMPGIGGFETCRKLKANENTKEIPVIFMTALAEVRSKVKGFSAGAVDYITKPFHEEEVLARVQTHLSLRTAQKKCQESERQLATVLSSLTEVVWSASLNPFQLNYINSAVEDIYGKPADSFLASPELWIEKVHPHDRERLEQGLLNASPGSILALEYRVVSHEALTRWVYCQAKVSFNQETNKVCLNGTVQDISKRKKAESQLRYVAQHDSLTKLANRSLFLDELESNFESKKNLLGEKWALLFLDLDRFKSINDSLGHGAGDKLLVRVSEVLLSAVRPSDVVARLGGDEFTVLLRNILDEEGVVGICRRIQEKLKIPVNVNGQSIHVTASIGIAMNSSSYGKGEDMLRDADIAMYQAKQMGKACHQFFTTDMYEKEISKITLEKELKVALERNEFSLKYQPIKNLSRNSLEGFEVLVRWNHPRRGVVLPSEFIPILEETGLIIEIGTDVLRRACFQMKQWHKLCLDDDSLFVSVNISAAQIQDPSFIKTVDKILVESGLSPSSLRLEITESMLLEKKELSLDLFQSLRRRGVRLSLDDFGTGYSSLSYLHNFPIDTLKIDRSFIQAMRSGISGFEIIRTIIALARSLQMNVVAEGVETEEQIDYLKVLNCDMVQGYFLSRPLSSKNAQALISKEFDSLESEKNLALLK